jgi:hypothetical protein
LADVTEEASPTGGDFLLGWESGGTIRKFDVGNLPTGGSGEVNVGSNLGAGVGVYSGKSGVTLQFHSIADTSTIAATLDAPNEEIDLAIVASSVNNTHLTDMAPWTVKLRNNAVSGDPQDVTESGLTEETDPDEGDMLLGWNSDGEIRKFDIDNLLANVDIVPIWHDEFASGLLPLNQRTLVNLETYANTACYLLVDNAEEEVRQSIDLAEGALLLQVPGTAGERAEVLPRWINHADYADNDNQPPKFGELWFRWDQKMDASWPDDVTETGTIMSQHIGGGTNPSIALELFEGDYKLRIRGDNNTGSWTRDVTPWIDSYSGDLGNWVQFALRFKQGTNGSDAYLEFWKDGVQVHSESGSEIGHLLGETYGPRFKYGIYNYPSSSFTHIAHFRNGAIYDGSLPPAAVVTRRTRSTSQPRGQMSHRFTRTLTTFPAASTKICDIDYSNLTADFRTCKVRVEASVKHSATGFTQVIGIREAFCGWDETTDGDFPQVVWSDPVHIWNHGQTGNFDVQMTDLSFAISGNLLRINCTADTSGSNPGFQSASLACDCHIHIEALPAGAVNLLIP